MNTIPGKFEVKLNDLLEYVSQEEIFQLIFNVYPEEGELYSSPFRVDTTPGCYFRYSDSGKLKFVDWGNPDDTILDCFEAVKLYYNLSSYTQVIHLIYEAFIEGKQPQKKPENNQSPIKPRAREKARIAVHKQDFTKKDLQYWSQYGISPENLREDFIFSVDKTYIKSAKGEFIIKSSCELSFADLSFKSGNRKVYFPEKTKEHKRRFITNCNQNDVGNLHNIDYSLNYIIIAKSHKDYRVLKNQGLSNTVYFTNEGQYPTKENLRELVKFFSNIYVFFDNDSTGVKASIKLKSILTELTTNMVDLIFIDSSLKSKDISDLYKYHGQEVCREFLLKTFKNILSKHDSPSV